jgi:DNA polymerase-3 subunit beta
MEEILHVIVEKNQLMKALSHCQGVVERRNTVPILGHILLETQGNTLKITATDLEISFIETLPAHIKEHGMTTVPAHLLFEVVRKLPEGSEVELKTTEDGAFLHLNSGRSTYNFSCLPPLDFPVMTMGELPSSLTIHAAELARLIDKTRFSMSTEETRYYLNGIFFHKTSDGFLRAVATDGLRLAQAQTELSHETLDVPEIIISRKTIHEIRKLIDNVAEDITLSLSENQVRFVVSSSILVSRLIEGKFPDYEKVIPSNNENMVSVEVKPFAEAIDRISIMSTDKLRSVKIKLEGSKMFISAHSTDTGNAVEELEINYSGESLDFGFNARYILDIAQQISGKDLQLLIGDEKQPVIAKDSTDPSALYVLMPMRV